MYTYYKKVTVTSEFVAEQFDTNSLQYNCFIG